MQPYTPIELVITNPSAIRRFCQKALRSKTEVFAILIGREEGDTVWVDEVVYPKRMSYITEDFVVYDEKEIRETPGAIGTIHSHPDREPALSKDDMISQASDGDIIFGVFSFWSERGETRRRTSLDWYGGSPEVRVRETTPSTPAPVKTGSG